MIRGNQKVDSMNEMRYDWLGDRWVIFAPNRLLRPDNYHDLAHRHSCQTITSSKEGHTSNGQRCPFCLGAEDQTPPATLTLRTDRQSTSDWSVRVVPNKFPAIDAPEEFCLRDEKSDRSTPRSDLFMRKQTRGGHEVIIEAPFHVQSITQLPNDHAALIFEAYQQRLKYWRNVQSMRYAVVFKNNGADAGASLVHAHSQLICTDFLPSDVLKTQKRTIEYQKTHGRCYVCDVLKEELLANQRIVTQSESFVALCPFASRLPYSVSILPKHHQSAFEACSVDQLRELATLAQQTLLAIELEHPGAAYNYVLQTAPLDDHDPAAFHWRLKILPRLIKVAGFEWSSDCYINTVLPEKAAQDLARHLPACSQRPCVHTSVPSQICTN